MWSKSFFNNIFMFYNFILIWNYFFATMVIICRNSLYSILSLVFTIVGSSFILFSLNVEFLSFIILLIYIGAITILFLFVVMMLQLHKDSNESLNHFFYSQDSLIYYILLLKIFSFIYFFNQLFSSSLMLISLEYSTDKEVLSSFLANTGSDTVHFISLFNIKVVLFIIIGLSLLFSMTGAIAVCLSQKVRKPFSKEVSSL